MSARHDADISAATKFPPELGWIHRRASWVAFALLGNGNRVFLTVVIILSIVLVPGVIYLFRVRPPAA